MTFLLSGMVGIRGPVLLIVEFHPQNTDIKVFLNFLSCYYWGTWGAQSSCASPSSAFISVFFDRWGSFHNCSSVCIY